MDALEASVSVARSPGTEPLVSVLVPSYNQEKYVIDCLESIRSLDYPNLELILSDDASSDATFEVAGRWIEEHRERFVRAVAVRQPFRSGVIDVDDRTKARPRMARNVRGVDGTDTAGAELAEADHSRVFGYCFEATV